MHGMLYTGISILPNITRIFTKGISRRFPNIKLREKSLKTIIIYGKVNAWALNVTERLSLSLSGNLYSLQLIFLFNSIIPNVARYDKWNEISIMLYGL